MEIVNTGHLGFSIRHGAFSLWVDPLLPSGGGVGPAECVLQEALPAPDCIAVTSAHPLHASRSSLRVLAGDAPVIGAESSLVGLLGTERTLQPCPIGVAVPVGPFELTFLPADGGVTLLITQGSESLWLLGPGSVDIGTAVAAFARTGGGHGRVVVSGYLDCPSTVIAGGARNFPVREHQRVLDTARTLRLAGFTNLLVAGGVRFDGAAHWLNAYADAVPLDELCEELRAFCGDGSVEPIEVGSADHGNLPVQRVGQATPFDPSLGIPELPGIGAAGTGVQQRLEALLQRAARTPWWPGFSAAAEAWRLRLGLREVSESGERWWSVELGRSTSVSPGYDPHVGMIVALTAAALERLLAGHATSHELGLAGQLRTFSRAYRLQGSAVQAPEAGASFVCPLPAVRDLLDAICSRSLVSPSRAA